MVTSFSNTAPVDGRPAIPAVDRVRARLQVARDVLTARRAVGAAVAVGCAGVALCGHAGLGMLAVLIGACAVGIMGRTG